jgi:DNA-binding response OmpR family regulator
VIIEDEADIRAALVAIFRTAGFTVHPFATGSDGVDGVRASNPDVVILDLGLADIDGFEVARRVRLFSDAYILVLTARTQELDTLLALEAGADDYVTKPFRPRELRYRVEALLRRPRTRSDSQAKPGGQSKPQDQSGPSPGAAVQEVLEHNGLRLDIQSRTVELSGTELRLTRSEFDLLRALLRGGRCVHSKDQLAQVLRGDQAGPDGFWSEADEQVVHVHVANLRRKLGDTPSDPQWVETVHGVGYRLAPAREPAARSDAGSGA